MVIVMAASNIGKELVYCVEIRGKYRVSINSFPDYKHLLQENYCMWNKNIFF